MTLSNSTQRKPPGPSEQLALGIDADTLKTLRRLQSDYGNVVSISQVNGRQACFINEPDDVRRLLVKHHTRYRKGPGFERVKMLLGNGLIVSDGDVWRRSRTMIQPAFSRQNVHRLIEVMVACAEARATRWQSIAEEGEALDITQEMSDFALELILRCIFGTDYETRILEKGENQFAFLSKDSARDLRVVMQVRQSRELILDVINARRDKGDAGQFDFLSMYMVATDRDGRKFTDEELLDEIITLIVAGYETSAGTLNWAWYLLARNPQAEAALLRESVTLVTSAAGIEQQTLTDMTYTQQLLEETLRLYPPVWLFTRRATEDDTLPNGAVSAGTDVYLSPYILHRTAEFWPDPEEFRPERFGDDSPYKKGDRPYFPFSLGPRRCLGEYFSFLEMKIHLGLLIQRFHMTLASDMEPEMDLGINLRTRQSIVLRPVLRKTD